MAILNRTYTSLSDSAKLKAPDGKELHIANILERSTPILEDLSFMECNLVTSHRSLIATELPPSSFVGYYEGVSPGKGKNQPVEFSTAMQKALYEADANLLKLNANESLALLDASEKQIAGMGQDFEDEIIYGDSSNPRKIKGLAATYDHISTDRNDIGYNVLSGGGAGADNTSIWIMYLGDSNIHGIYPKGSSAGLQMSDYGEDLTTAPNGVGQYKSRRIFYEFDGGIAIPDWRAGFRIANIDVSELQDAGTSTYDGANLINLLITALYRVPKSVKTVGRAYIYANTEVVTALHLLANNKTTLALSVREVIDSEPMVMFNGIPIRIADRILNTEAVVTT